MRDDGREVHGGSGPAGGGPHIGGSQQAVID